jgi:hypothetical protein
MVVNRIDMVQDKGKWLAAAKKVINIWLALNGGNFLTS